MDRLTRYAIILVIGLSCAEIRSVANSEVGLQNKTGKKATGSVSGRITVKGKGKGGIVVTAHSGESRSRVALPSKAITDEDGNYRISDLAGGSYQIVPVAPAFVVSDFNSMGRQGKVLLLADGENVEDIDFSMVRGGVITGKVNHADGRPVIEERIHVVPSDASDRQGLPIPMQSGSVYYTDDLGIYRIFGLPSGMYKISVGQVSDNFGGGFGGPSRSPFELTFHSDPSTPNEAKLIELREGAEATNVDITVGQRISGFSVAGVVVDVETNKPVPNLRFGIQRVTGPGRSFTGGSQQSDRFGGFRFENLIPGKYSLVNMPQPNSDLRGEAVTFEVVDQDVTGLMVKVSKGASLSGTVVLEGQHDKTVQSKIARLRLHAYNRNELGGSGFVESSLVNPDGSFRIVGLQPGVVQFHLSSQDLESLKSFAISRVEMDGVVLPLGVEIESGAQIFGAKVVVSYASGSVRGTIKAENGPLPENARFMVRLMKPEDHSMVGRPDVDARGRFVVAGVPAGTYELHVQVFIPGARTRSPSSRQSVSVTEGSATDVEVVLTFEVNPPTRP